MSKMAFRKNYIEERFNINDIREYIPKDHFCYLIEENCWSNGFLANEKIIIEILMVILLIILVCFLDQLFLGYIERLASDRAIARRIRTDMTYIYFMWF